MNKKDTALRPVIGITAEVSVDKKSICVKKEYIDAVSKAKGSPVILPIIQDEYLLDNVHGVIITGGKDIPAHIFGEKSICNIDEEITERIEYDLWLIHRLKERGIPTLGICYGMQIVNVAFNGTLYQNLQVQCNNELHYSHDNDMVHQVEVKPATILSSLTNNKDIIKVNSKHRQAIKDIATGFIISGISRDDIIEAIEAIDGWFLGIQWHPERLDDNISRNIFTYLIKKALKNYPLLI